MGEREGWGSNDHDVDEFAPVFTHAHEIGHLLGFNHGEGRWIGPNPYSPHDQSRPRETYTNARKGNLLEWGLMQGDGAGPEVMDNGYHGVYRSCPNPLNPFYRRDLGWITPTPVTGSQDNFEIEPGTVHLIDRTTHEYLLERRAHDGPRFHNSGIRINGINGISFGRYLLFHEYEDEDPGLFIWRRETQIAGAEERPILIVADERRIADARDQDQNPNTPQYQDMRFDPFPGLGNVSAVDALTPDMGLRQATQGILDRNGMPTSIGEQVDPGEVGLALTNITRTEVAGRADRLTVDVIFRPSAPSNLTVAAGDGAATLRWDDPDDFTLDRWEYQQQGLSDWVEIPVDDDQLTRDEATGTLSYPVLSLTHGEMYSFEVRAHNAAGWGPAAGPVEVTLNTAPVVSGPETPSFDEDSEQPVATYTATDAEGDAITWSLTGADAAAFSPPSDAAGNSFDLSFRSAPNYENPTDANLDTVYEVTVVATDDGMPPMPASYPVMVSVTNVDEEGSVELPSTAPKVGDRLTAELTDPDMGIEVVEWHWQALPPGTRSTHPPGPGASTASSLLVTSEHIGLTLSAQVTYVDGESEDANDRKSAQSAATAPVVDVPSAPRNLEAAAGNARVELRWDPPLTDNGSALTGYVVRHRSDGGANWMSETLAVTTRHTVRDLTNGLEYTFEVRAVNGAGEGASASDTATPERPDTRGRVEWSTTQPQVGQELTPTLIDPDAPALAEARWRWRRQRWSRSDAGDSLSAPAPESRSGESKLAVIARTRQYTPQVSDLHQWLRVEVTYTDDYTGDSRRHRVSATASRAVGPGPPCAPANLKAKPGDGQVTLTWEAGCNNGGTIDRYQYRRPDAVKWVRVPGDGSARRQQVEGLTNGEAHTFEVRARNRQEWGPAAQATATPAAAESPPPPPPPPMTVTYEASSYSAQEGGEAATVTVRLSPPASQALRIPIAVNPPSGDFAVSGLTDGELSFAPEADEATFTVTANEDADTVDEEVTLGFGTPLPEGVSAGDPARATVTLFDDDDAPGDDPEGPVGTPGEVRLSTTTPQVGTLLTAVLTDPDGGIVVQTWHWQWRARDTDEWEPPLPSSRYPGLTSFTPQAEHVGKRLRVTVSYTDGHGPDSAQSEETEPVTWPSLTVFFSSSTYEATEGGEAATVTVRLSPSASEALRIPIAVNPPSGDFTVAGLTDGELSFSSGAELQTFTVTATQDDDWDDEEVTLGFVTPLPEGVSAGDPARATVTLFDDDPPEDDPEDPEGPVGTPGEVRLSTTTPQVDRELTATLVDEDGYLRDISWRWERRSGPGSAWRDIEPPDDRTPHTDLSRYRPSSSDEGQQLRATVSYTDGHGPGKSAQSAETDPVQRPDRQGTVRLSTTTPQVGRELTATLVDEDGYLRDISWRWERRSGPGSAWRDIEPPDDRTPHTDLSRYRPSSSDEGQQLRATVSYTDGHGPGKSAQSAGPIRCRGRTSGHGASVDDAPQVGREPATLVDEDGEGYIVAVGRCRRGGTSSRRTTAHPIRICRARPSRPTRVSSCGRRSPTRTGTVRARALKAPRPIRCRGRTRTVVCRRRRRRWVGS